MENDFSLVVALMACSLSGCSTLDGSNATTSSLKKTETHSTVAVEPPLSAKEAQRDACAKWRIAWKANPDDHQGMTQEQWRRKGQVCADVADSKS